MNTPSNPGYIAFFGSGETSPSGRRVFETLFNLLPLPIRTAVLETPAGFELNSDWVAGQVADFLKVRLQNYNPQVDVLPARRRDSPFSPDDLQIIAPMFQANLLYMGAGSPTYAVRQLRGSLAWALLQARHRLGAMLVMASASTLAAGAYMMPVYEIYKVGEDLHWKQGLDLFGPFGLKLVFVPHWNNQDGGQNLDTSRCFMGLPRFEALQAMLPGDAVIVGIEEHTALLFDLPGGTCQVMGRDGVVVMRSGQSAYFPNGSNFPLTALGTFRAPTLGEGLPEALVRQAVEEHNRPPAPNQPPPPPQAVLDLVAARQAARQEKNWPLSDALRAEIQQAGWQVTDTPDGPQLSPLG